MPLANNMPVHFPYFAVVANEISLCDWLNSDKKLLCNETRLITK